MTQAIFDGHNDVLLRLWRAGDHDGKTFLEPQDTTGHLDHPRAVAGGFAGGLFATFVPPGGRGRDEEKPIDGSRPDIPPVDQPTALAISLEQAAILSRMARLRPDLLRQCRTVAEIEATMTHGAMACALHMEGADAIDPGLGALEILYNAGLRSLGLVWSRQNAFAYGVPFRFPSTPDIGPGLTDAGRRLVRRCNELGILLDLSHLNGAGFREVAGLSDAPLVATHSNAHALSPSSRNLTNEQLAAIRASGGVVGLNYATFFLREDGRREDVELEAAVRHLDHLVEHLGEGGVALGSDFDGAPPPSAIGDAAGLPNLVAAMRSAGWDDALVQRVCTDNWLDVLRRTWK